MDGKCELHSRKLHCGQAENGFADSIGRWPRGFWSEIWAVKSRSFTRDVSWRNKNTAEFLYMLRVEEKEEEAVEIQILKQT